MNKYKRYIPIAAVVLAALGFNLDRFGIDLEAIGNGAPIFGSQSNNNQGAASRDSDAPAASSNHSGLYVAGKKWSNTSPNINQAHIFDGEINSRGKPTGFHSRPGGKDPSDARLVSVKDQPNRYGVYTANIEVRDGSEWKSKFSSFFPDNLSEDDVLGIILHAYKNSKNPDGTPWEGPSGVGYRVQGYTSGKGGINTAYPLFTRN